MAKNYNLTNQSISSSFDQLLQKNDTTGYLVDGTGSVVEGLIISGTVSGSFFVGDGSGLTNVAASASLPAGVVSGSSQIILQDTTGDLSGSRIDGAVDSASFAATTLWTGIIGTPGGLVSGSVQVSDITGSSLVTASITDATVTFTKGDGSTFDITVDNTQNAIYSQNTITTGKNLHTLTIAKGTPLYFTGSGTAGNLVGVYPADAGNPNRMPAGGIAGENIAVGAEGVVLLDGFINGVNTSIFGAGDKVYVGVGGGYTNVEPTGSALIQFLGNVEKSATNGSGVIQMMGEARRLPNITTGHFWVGDGNSVPQEVATSSITIDTSSLVTTSSFNTYTSSTDGRLDSLESETGSYAKTNVNNTFTGTQNFDNINVTGTGSFSYIQSVTGSAKIVGDAFIILNNDIPPQPYGGLKVIDTGSTDVTASLLWDGINNHWIYENVSSASYGAGGFISGPRSTGITNILYPTLNRLTKGQGGDHITSSAILDDGTKVRIDYDVEVTGAVTASTFVGNLEGTATSASYSQNAADLRGDFNTYTSSTDSRLNSIEGVTGSYATTGSNVFVGNQTVNSASLITFNSDVNNPYGLKNAHNFFTSATGITQTLIANSGSNDDLNQAKSYISSFAASGENLGTALFNVVTRATGSGYSRLQVRQDDKGDVINIYAGQGGNSGITVSTPGNSTIQSIGTEARVGAYENTFEGDIQLFADTSGSYIQDYSPLTSAYSNAIKLQPFSSYNNGLVEILRNVEISGSTTGLGGFVGDLVGTASEATLLNGTSSTDFATLTSNTFTGGQILSGSVQTEVVFETIASLTASVDFSDSSLFVLNLVSGSDTHITAANVGKGHTVNVLVQQPSVGFGTVSFSPDFLQVSGSPYVPTEAASAKDILTLINFDSGSEIFVANIQNFV